ncbi:MAG: hypothetical protein ACYS0K_03060 [Planctomycetota bacterium]
MRWAFLLALTLALPLLGGCPPPPIEPSQDVNQDAITQEYSVLYDGATDWTTVEAQFWFGVGGTTLQLSPPSTLTHNDVALALDTSFGAKYVRSVRGFVDSHDWEWADTEGTVYLNTCTMHPVSFVEPPERISRTEVAVFEFEPPLEVDEAVLLEDADDEVFLLFAYSTDPGATAVSLTPEAMEYIPENLDRLALVFIRTQILPLQESTSRGGTIETESRSEWITVILDP